jgi:NTE family protein
MQALAQGRSPVVPALPAGGIPTAAISTGINTLFAGGWPDDPLWICAVDMRTGQRVVFGAPGSPDAPVGSAVAASAAIPSYFAPVSINGRRYVDGGVNSLVNLDLVAERGLDLVVVSSPLSHASPVPWPAASTPMRQLLRARLRVEVAAVRRAGPPVVVIEPGRRVSAAMGLNPMDARRRGAVSRATTEAVGDWLARGVTGRRLAEALRGVARPPAPEPESDTAVG